MNYKNLYKLGAVIAALALTTLTTSALTIGDVNYIGKVDPSTPSDAGSEVAYINYLLGLAPNATSTATSGTVGAGGNAAASHDFTRSATSTVGLPTAVVTGTVGNGTSTSLNVTGWSYLFGKYGNDGHLWFVGNLSGSQNLPSTVDGSGGLSHSDLFNFDPNGSGNPGGNVPDAGATAILLGLGMVSMAFVRRKS